MDSGSTLGQRARSVYYAPGQSRVEVRGSTVLSTARARSSVASPLDLAGSSYGGLRGDTGGSARVATDATRTLAAARARVAELRNGGRPRTMDAMARPRNAVARAGVLLRQQAHPRASVLRGSTDGRRVDWRSDNNPTLARAVACLAAAMVAQPPGGGRAPLANHSAVWRPAWPRRPAVATTRRTVAACDGLCAAVAALRGSDAAHVDCALSSRGGASHDGCMDGSSFLVRSGGRQIRCGLIRRSIRPCGLLSPGALDCTSAAESRRGA